MVALFPFANVGRILPIIAHFSEYVELFMRTYIGDGCYMPPEDPALAYNGLMDHSKLVLVQAFGSEAEADLAKSMFESAGIDSMIQADTAGGMRDHLAWSGFGFKVLVRDEDAAGICGRHRSHAA